MVPIGVRDRQTDENVGGSSNESERQTDGKVRGRNGDNESE